MVIKGCVETKTNERDLSVFEHCSACFVVFKLNVKLPECWSEIGTRLYSPRRSESEPESAQSHTTHRSPPSAPQTCFSGEKCQSITISTMTTSVQKCVQVPVCCNIPLYCHLACYSVKSNKWMRCMDIAATLASINYEVMNNHKLPNPNFFHPKTHREL